MASERIAGPDEESFYVGCEVGESVVSAVDELAMRRYTSRSALLREALNRYLAEEVANGESEPADAHREAVRLPDGFNASQRRVYDHLVAVGCPLRTTELAEVIGIHPGNIDRALRVLREAGYIQSGRGYHRLADLSGDQGVAATG